MKKLQQITISFLMTAFMTASLLCCCTEQSASAATTVAQPACHQHQNTKPAQPTKDHQCCQKTMMMPSLFDQAMLKATGLVRANAALSTLHLTASYHSTITSFSQQFWPISPQKFPSLALYLKTHTLRL